VEAGGGLTGALLRVGLIDEAWVFVGPRLLADEEAFGPARGFTTERIVDGHAMRLLSVRRRGPDALLHYRFGG
jgi:riboflavin biosynthesis pyrimidine reductase